MSVQNQVTRKTPPKEPCPCASQSLVWCDITQEYGMTFVCKESGTDWMPFLNVRDDPTTLQNETSLLTGIKVGREHIIRFLKLFGI